MAWKIDQGLKLRDELSSSLADPFRLITMYLITMSVLSRVSEKTSTLLCPSLIRCARRVATMPYPIQNSTLISESPCRFLATCIYTHLRNIDFHWFSSFFHFLHPGRNRLLKHSSHLKARRLGNVASKSRYSERARLKIEIQFRRGTVIRAHRFFSDGSYAPHCRFRRMGFLHGLSDESELTLCNFLDR